MPNGQDLPHEGASGSNPASRDLRLNFPQLEEGVRRPQSSQISQNSNSRPCSPPVLEPTAPHSRGAPSFELTPEGKF